MSSLIVGIIDCWAERQGCPQSGMQKAGGKEGGLGGGREMAGQQKIRGAMRCAAKRGSRQWRVAKAVGLGRGAER